MSKELFKEAIADAKAVREAALANAKAALEEALTPKLQSMLAAKLQEIEEIDEAKEEDEKMDEAKKSEDEKMEEGMMPDVTGDTIQDKYRATGAALEEADEELEEDFDLSEILAELNDEKEEVKEAKEEEEEEEETEEEEEEGGEEEEEVEVKDLTIEDLKDLIKDIISQEMDTEMPADEEEIVPVDAMSGELPANMGAETEEDEIDLEELLAELDSLDEADDKEEMDEAKKKEDKEEMKEAIDPEILNSIGGFAAVIGAGAGIAKLMLNSAKKEIADKFKKAGKPVPSDKELEKLAAMAVKGGIDKTTGGASFSQSTTGKGSGLGVSEELAEAIETIETLRSELNEVNLLNAKLLYVNKLFKAKNLTESQKLKVIASFDKATNVKEAKVVFESLESAINTPAKKAIKESLGFASKAAGVAPNKSIVESNDVISRMQKLANIK
jgi:hypothetical protein